VCRLRANVSRLRTIFAARSDSLRIVSSPRACLVGGALREPLGPGQDRGERVVQLVRDAGDRLPERRELLGLEQLVVEIARLVFEALALADVAHQRLDADVCSPEASACAVTSIQIGVRSARRSRSR
jgi:hypothetical protein